MLPLTEGCNTVVSDLLWTAAALAGCAELHREAFSAAVSLGLEPHSHLHHREKGMHWFNDAP